MSSQTTPTASGAPATRTRRLSTRQLEVLRMLSLGHNTHEISLALDLRPETVRTHVKRACQKLGARNTVHAVSLAIRAGLI